jgi:hypothetical protein
MPRPILINCPKNMWTLVESSIKKGELEIYSSRPEEYLVAWRNPGEKAPTKKIEGFSFKEERLIEIHAISPIKIYVYATLSDGSVAVHRHS